MKPVSKLIWFGLKILVSLEQSFLLAFYEHSFRARHAIARPCDLLSNSFKYITLVTFERLTIVVGDLVCVSHYNNSAKKLNN